MFTTQKEDTHAFAVGLQPIYTAVPLNEKTPFDPSDKEIMGKKAVVRQDTGAVLGIVSSGYALLKHGDVVDSFRQALAGMDFTEKIQLAKNGAQLFATYKLNAVKVEVAKGDVVSLQFVVKNSYDGSNALQIMLGAYRLVCSNGMVVGKHFFSFSQKHVGSRSVNAIGSATTINVETIREKIDMLIGQFKTVLPELQQMSRFETLRTSEELFTVETLKLPAYLIEKAKEVYDKDGDRTMWGVYNACTSAITHNMKKESPIATLNYGKIAWDFVQNAMSF